MAKPGTRTLEEQIFLFFAHKFKELTRFILQVLELEVWLKKTQEQAIGYKTKSV